MNLKVYYFIDEFNKNEIEKLSSRISLIYRNYENKCDFSELKKLVLYCKNILVFMALTKHYLD